MEELPTSSEASNPLNSINRITAYKDDVNITKLFTCGFDESSPQIEQFVNCIIKFDGFMLLVSSFGAFYQNHKYHDDYAQSIIYRVIKVEA